MVSSISPAGVGALGVDPRLPRAQAAPNSIQSNNSGASGDRVEVGDASAWKAARESVRVAIEDLARTLEIGEEADALLTRIQELGRTYGENPASAEAELRVALQDFGVSVRAAVAAGMRTIAGENLSVQAEPGGAPILIEGLDMRLEGAPHEGGVFSFSQDASFGDDPQAMLDAVMQSRTTLRAGLARLMEQSQALEAHQGFLGAAAGALEGVRSDIDADTARLMALQVRQGLEGFSGGAIANVEPQAVLSLFRA